MLLHQIVLRIFFASLLFNYGSVFAQDYNELILKHREAYKKEFLEDEQSPLNKRELRFLRFYAPDSNYVVNGQFTRIDDTVGFDMHTHNGVIKRYFVYGKVAFRLNGTAQRLFVYQSAKLRTKEGFEDHLFIPFTDETNYRETFGGGRYLDLRFADIVNGELHLDFNKCYNPYCAFKEGYACPIPPKENDLKIPIPVGEKLFGRKR